MEASCPNIVGTFTVSSRSGGGTSGCLSNTGSSYWTLGGGAAGAWDFYVTLNASEISDIFNDDNTLNPSSIKTLLLIKY